MLFSTLSCLAGMLVCGAAHAPALALPTDSDGVKDTVQLPLTVDALHNMTTFWAAFMQKPSSVRNDGRKANQKPLSLSIPIKQDGSAGTQEIALPEVVDMCAMAAKFRSVATDLAKSHLTAQQWMQYRHSLYSARLTDQFDRAAHPDAASSPVADTKSVAWANVAFLRAHQSELDALIAKGMRFPIPDLPQALVAVGQPAPQLTAIQWLGNSKTSKRRTTFGDGHVYLLNITAHWCIPCREAYSSVEALKKKYAAQGIQVIYSTRLFGYYDTLEYIPPRKEFDLLKQYLPEHHLTAPVLVADPTELGRYAKSFPTFVVIDGAGKVQYINSGWLGDLSEVDTKLAELTGTPTPIVPKTSP